MEVLENILRAEEILDAELHSEVKHEFINGKLTEMAGGSYLHNKIKFEIALLLEMFFRSSGKPFEVLDSDMKTWIEAIDKYHYPDITVIATPPQFYVTPEGTVRRDAITNPVLLVEVLSDETRSFDKGEKFEHYCALPSFREYLLVEPEKHWMKTIYLENPEAGLQRVTTVTDPEASIFLHSIGYELRLADVYKVLKTLNG